MEKWDIIKQQVASEEGESKAAALPELRTPRMMDNSASVPNMSAKRPSDRK